LAWLGPDRCARATLPELASLRAQPGEVFPKKLLPELGPGRFCRDSPGQAHGTATRRIRGCTPARSSGPKYQWTFRERRDAEKTVDSVSFLKIKTVRRSDSGKFFRGKAFDRPFSFTPVVTIPGNARLTVTKAVASFNSLLNERGISDQIQTVAITYDPCVRSSQAVLPPIMGCVIAGSAVFAANHRMLRAYTRLCRASDSLPSGGEFRRNLW